MRACGLKFNDYETSATPCCTKLTKCDVKMQMTSSKLLWNSTWSKVCQLNNQKDTFLSFIRGWNFFLADKQITGVEIAVQQSQRQFYASAKDYGENPTVIKTETFFGIFETFNRNFNNLRQELNGLEL